MYVHINISNNNNNKDGSLNSLSNVLNKKYKSHIFAYKLKLRR